MTHPRVEGLRLLLVEDEYLLASHLCEIFEELGAQIVGPAASVKDAMRLLDEVERIDVGILDVNLRGETTEAIADVLAVRGVPSCSPRAIRATCCRRRTAACRCAPSRSIRSSWRIPSRSWGCESPDPGPR